MLHRCVAAATIGRLSSVVSRAEELAREVVDAWTRADREEFLALMDPDVEMYLPRSAVEERAYHGLEGAAQAWADGFDIWERFRVEVRAVRPIGDLLLAEYHSRQELRGEGPPVEYTAYAVFECRAGRIAYWRPYLDRDEALAAAEARATRGPEPV